jgi:hypothetical protein
MIYTYDMCTTKMCCYAKWLCWPNKVTIRLIHIVVICVTVPWCSLTVGHKHSEQTHNLRFAMKEYQHFGRISYFHLHGKMGALCSFETLVVTYQTIISCHMPGNNMHRLAVKASNFYIRRIQKQFQTALPVARELSDQIWINWLCWHFCGFSQHFHRIVTMMGYGHIVPCPFWLPNCKFLQLISLFIYL